MKINIITIGKSRSTWVESGFAEYAKRMPKDYQLNLIEIQTIRRTMSANIKQIAYAETEKLVAAVPKNNLIVALDEHGREWTTIELSQKISTWHHEHQDISFLIGGPDGLDDIFLQNTKTIWSLAKLTLPHQLVRVIVAEQIYRAWTIINNHPYHRN